ncbi:MAG: HEAT repeat domain-containing protein [Elusimicrobiota bacterium]|jgi:HEAT repeat protein
MRRFHVQTLFLIGFCGSVLAASFNAAGWRERLLSGNSDTENQALSEIERLSLDERKQLALALAQPLNKDAVSARQAAGVLSRLGPAAEGVVFDLVEALRYDDPAVYPMVSEALIKIGPGAVKPLQKALGDSNFFVRQRSAEILGRLGPNAKRAAPTLVDLLKDAQPDVRTAAEITLIQLGADAVPALSEALRREPEAHRKILIVTLGKCGPEAVSPLLLELKRDESVFLRADAATALSQIQPLPATVIPALLAALDDLDEGVRSAAIDALGQLASGAKAALGPLVMIERNDKEAVVRAKADRALAQIGKGSPESMPGFIRALHETDENVRQDIIALLGQSDIPIQEAMPVLENSIRDTSPAVRLRVVEAAGLLSKSSDAGLAILKVALGDPQPDIRAAAIKSLGAMREAPGAAAAELAVVLKDPNPALRQKAIQALGELGLPGLPGLVQELNDPYTVLSEEAAKAILTIGPEALPALQPLAEGTDPVMSKRAKELIQKIHRRSRPQAS